MQRGGFECQTSCHLVRAETLPSVLVEVAWLVRYPPEVVRGLGNRGQATPAQTWRRLRSRVNPLGWFDPSCRPRAEHCAQRVAARGIESAVADEE